MVKEQKLKQVEELRQKISKSNVVGIIDTKKLPSRQYQQINKKIRDEVDFLVMKKSVILHALEASDPRIKVLGEKIPKNPMLVFTSMDPFKFYMTASKLRSPNYAKDGDVSEEEIEIKAGPTDLMPGPVISEFSKCGIVAGVEGGKIAVKKDKVVAKKGDVISKDLANILRKLKIQPIRVGLNIVAIYQDGSVYMKDVLSLAGQGYIDQMVSAHQGAINLSVNIGYPTKENIGTLLAKAEREAQAISSIVKTETPKSEQSQTQGNQDGG